MLFKSAHNISSLADIILSLLALNNVKLFHLIEKWAFALNVFVFTG